MEIKIREGQSVKIATKVQKITQVLKCPKLIRDQFIKLFTAIKVGKSLLTLKSKVLSLQNASLKLQSPPKQISINRSCLQTPTIKYRLQ